MSLHGIGSFGSISTLGAPQLGAGRGLESGASGIPDTEISTTEPLPQANSSSVLAEEIDNAERKREGIKTYWDIARKAWQNGLISASFYALGKMREVTSDDDAFDSISKELIDTPLEKMDIQFTLATLLLLPREIGVRPLWLLRSKTDEDKWSDLVFNILGKFSWGVREKIYPLLEKGTKEADPLPVVAFNVFKFMLNLKNTLSSSVTPLPLLSYQKGLPKIYLQQIPSLQSETLPEDENEPSKVMAWLETEQGKLQFAYLDEEPWKSIISIEFNSATDIEVQEREEIFRKLIENDQLYLAYNLFDYLKDILDAFIKQGLFQTAIEIIPFEQRSTGSNSCWDLLCEVFLAAWAQEKKQLLFTIREDHFRHLLNALIKKHKFEIALQFSAFRNFEKNRNFQTILSALKKSFDKEFYQEVTNFLDIPALNDSGLRFEFIEMLLEEQPPNLLGAYEQAKQLLRENREGQTESLISIEYQPSTRSNLFYRLAKLFIKNGNEKESRECLQEISHKELREDLAKELKT